MLLALLLLAGCATKGRREALPVACRAGQDAVEAALRAAPQPVRLDGTPLSACLDPASDGADLQSVGTSLVGAATALSDRAAGRPEGRDALELGYLAGAMRRGAGPVLARGGATELMRRVDQELAVLPRSHAIVKGLRAGRRTG